MKELLSLVMLGIIIGLFLTIKSWIGFENTIVILFIIMIFHLIEREE